MSFPTIILDIYVVKCKSDNAFTALELIIHWLNRYDKAEVELILCLIKQRRDNNHPTFVFLLKIIQLETPHLFSELIF